MAKILLTSNLLDVSVLGFPLYSSAKCSAVNHPKKMLQIVSEKYNLGDMLRL